MATTGLQINVGADVKDAVSGFKQLTQQLSITGKTAGTIAAGGVIGLGVAALKAFGIIDDFQKKVAELGDAFLSSLNPQKKYTDAISESTPAVVKNIGVVTQLVNALENGKLSYSETLAAQKQLVTLAPTFKDAFDKNGTSVKNLSNVLYDEYIPALINTIRLNAATAIINAKLSKSFETIASNGALSGLEKLQNALVDALGPIAGTKTSQFGKLNQALQRLSPETIAAEIKVVYDNLGISVEDFGTRITKAGAKIAEQKDILEAYRNQIAAITFRESALGSDLLREKLDLATKTFEDFLNKGIKPNTTAFQFINAEVQKFISQLPQIEAITKQIESISNLDPTIKLPQVQQSGININRADRTSSIIITAEALQKQGEYLLGQDKLLEKLAKQQELITGISTASNSFIDSFFGALANNQDPFEALAQSAKRLVFELGAAVAKAFALKAIASLISGGSSGGVDLLSNVFKGTIRGSDLRLLTFQR